MYHVQSSSTVVDHRSQPSSQVPPTCWPPTHPLNPQHQFSATRLLPPEPHAMISTRPLKPTLRTITTPLTTHHKPQACPQEAEGAAEASQKATPASLASEGDPQMPEEATAQRQCGRTTAQPLQSGLRRSRSLMRLMTSSASGGLRVTLLLGKVRMGGLSICTRWV